MREQGHVRRVWRGMAWAALAIAVCAAPAQDSPFYRGPNGNGTYPTGRLRTNWTQSPPAAAWRQSVGYGFSGVAVAGGRAVTAGYLKAENRSRVQCYDAATGESRWHVAYEDACGGWRGSLYGPLATPAIDSNRVYMVAAMGAVYCFDAQTGREIWRQMTNRSKDLRRPGGQYGDGVSPVIAGDLVVVQTTTLENRAAWHALEKRTGDLRWSVPVPARKPKQRVDLVDRPYSPAVPCAVGGEPHLILVGNAAIDCVARDTGARTFSHSIEDLQIAYGPFPEPVFFAPDRFFLGVWYSRQANAVVFRLGAEGMTREWSNRSIGKDTYSYVVLDSHAYGHGARGLQCVDLSSGDVRWEWRPGDRGRRKDSFEVIAVGHALVWISSSGTLYAGSASPRGPEPVAEFQAFAGFDADLRKERAQFNLSVCTSPAFAQGRIYCRSSWGELVCLDVNAGPPRQ